MKRKQRTSLVGIELRSDRLRVAELRMHGGRTSVERSASLPLAIDVFAGDPELSANEIRLQLEAAEIRTHEAVLCLSAANLLVQRVDLAGVPEVDIDSLLALEAERAFPFPPEEIVVAGSRLEDGEGNPWATLVAVPVSHLLPQLTVLRKARVRLVSITAGAVALLDSQGGEADAVMLADSQGLQLAAEYRGGVALLRSFETSAVEGGTEEDADVLDDMQRELRISLRRAPRRMLQGLKRVRVFASDRMAESVQRRVDAELAEGGLAPVNAGVTEDGTIREGDPGQAFPELVRAASLALKGCSPALEFWRPREGRWRGRLRRLLAKGLLVRAGLVAGLLVVLLIGAFAIQAWRAGSLERQWAAMENDVEHLQQIQDEIRARRPWADVEPDRLEIVRALTEAFPETGSVWVRTLEIRETDLVECAGSARSTRDYLAMLETLRKTPGVTGLQVGQVKGGSPIQFSFQYTWKRTPTHE
jgi:Tfp pilus assembly protein PilN